ncbi:hypothetical protein D3C85_1471550 [compost metagenome]
MLLGDHRTDLGLRVGRVTDDQALGAGGEFGDELRVHALLDEDPAASGATLAVQREDGEQRSVQGTFQISVFEDQHRRLAAQFHRVLLQAGGLHDLLTGGGATGEGDCAHIRVSNQSVAGSGAVALDDVEHAIRNAGFDGQTA